jgi:hypothetical protein
VCVGERGVFFGGRAWKCEGRRRGRSAAAAPSAMRPAPHTTRAVHPCHPRNTHPLQRDAGHAALGRGRLLALVLDDEAAACVMSVDFFVPRSVSKTSRERGEEGGRALRCQARELGARRRPWSVRTAAWRLRRRGSPEGRRLCRADADRRRLLPGPPHPALHRVHGALLRPRQDDQAACTSNNTSAARRATGLCVGAAPPTLGSSRAPPAGAGHTPSHPPTRPQNTNVPGVLTFRILLDLVA